MLTRCPYPRCKYIFDVAPEAASEKYVVCLQCRQKFSFRSLEAEKQLELAAGRRLLLPENADKPPASFNALLEDVRSLHNVGSILRSADGAGFTRIYLCGITGSPPHKSIAKTSLGAEDHLAFSYHKNALEVLDKLRQENVAIVGLEKTSTSQPLSQLLAQGAIRTPVCLLVGNEVNGLSEEVMQNCDLLAHLPMHGHKESLNVAVAFGIAVYYLREFGALNPQT